ncbi:MULTISPECIES: PadR family transcriptional regulator [Rhodococcus]|uniref:PadR family transcriptional regulator n=1 Tax=Rhodococcus oxybenzonivorans TaxID=1990687 RepID=A0AAE4UX83_9NOCA|nr:MULTISPECIES: PadR family transcriptional regulator [Rhodococcus]MDV7245654.1 PadR family transcriptional regulator [Rhodococcus oxybenzonivorans]MDV7264347.1 PadR family transcriptional regulator [Rhodococcus oxybenzonivorans]MDV7276991.1 PadR family transcriptional regulator [Rhodococcus oxybenzonivorans]MDV7336677.1 PadR family transcriptional regulator [Rhodococcus oxybenzonivorans]MDV7346555.1 PadR family transcriptional regulator [Rhodococcus oxybenzonivorans]
MVLTPLAVTILGLLNERTMHPYEMYQLADTRRGRLVKIRPGSLYHTVNRLEAERLVRTTGTDRAGNRPERTMYEITDSGRDALGRRVSDMLAAPAREYPQFPLALAEAHNLESGAVVDLLRERLGRLDQEIDELVASADGNEAPPRIFNLGNEYLLTVARAERDWLRALVSDIDSGTLSWLEFLEGLTFARPDHSGSAKD